MTYEEGIIRGEMERAGVKSRAALSIMTDIEDQRMRSRFRDPDKITLGELRVITEKLQSADKTILALAKGESSLKDGAEAIL